MIQVLEVSFVRLKEELGQCKNQTGILSEEFKALTQAILDKEHLMPRTLKGEKFTQLHLVFTSIVLEFFPNCKY